MSGKIILNMEPGVTLSGSNSYYGVIYCEQGSVTINSGKISGTKYGLKVGGDGYVYINSAEVTGVTAGVYHDTGHLYINNGATVKGNTYGIQTCAGSFMGGLKIEGGTVTGGTYSVYDSDNYGGSSIYLSGGSLTNGVCSTSGTIGNMLNSGYAYRKTDGTWVMDNSVKSISESVTVEQIPVEITAEPTDPAEVEYGYADANAPVINVTAENIDGNTNGITYQWYQKGANGDTLISGATSASYLPKGLGAGSHQYYCAVTCDQYTLNSSVATVTVSKSTPTVSFKAGYISEKDYDGQPFSNPTADELSLSGVNYNDVEFIWSPAAGSSLTEGKPVNAGKYILTVHIPQTDNYDEVSITKDITINSVAGNITVPETNISKNFRDVAFSLNCTINEGGTLSYTSSNENVAEVSDDGIVTIKGVGTATITVTGIGNYTGTTTVDLTIEPKSLTDNMVTIASGPYYYTGSSVTPEVTVKDGDSALISGTDYTVSYENNVNVGSIAKVTVTGMGNYQGSISKTYTIGYRKLPSGKSLSDYVTISPEPVNGWYNADITLTPKSGCGVGDTSAGIGNGAVTISEETGEAGSTKTIYVKDSNGNIYQTEFTYKLDKTPPATDEPATDEPATDEPTTDEPTTDEPATDEHDAGNISKDVIPGANTPKTELATSVGELSDIVLTDDEKDAVNNGTDIKISLVVEDGTNIAPAGDKAKVETAINDMQGYKLGQYLDVKLLKIIGDTQEKVTEINVPITVKFEIPEAFRKEGCEYCVIRIHDGEVAVLPDLDDDDKTITIKTDKFSTYALAYSEKTDGKPADIDSTSDTGTNKADSPKTGDGIPVAGYAMLAIMAGLSCLIMLLSNSKRDKKKNL